jgi:cytochrome c-type biogenesis protein
MSEITIFVALLAGLVSFLSPCILPILPGFLAYLSGTTSVEETSRKETFLNSLFFVLGFSVIFALLGVLLNTVLEGISYDVQIWLSRIGGIVIILFALQILGLIKIPFLMREHQIEVKKKFKWQYLTSFIFGASFAVGWSPCVGAILGSVFALAISSPGQSFILLISYAIGLGIPFLVVGFFTDSVLKTLRKYNKFLKYFNIVVGILLLILGVLVFTNNLNLVASFLPMGWL